MDNYTQVVTIIGPYDRVATIIASSRVFNTLNSHGERIVYVVQRL